MLTQQNTDPTRRRSLVRRSLAGIAALSMVMAACGSDDDTAVDAEPTETEAPAETDATDDAPVETDAAETDAPAEGGVDLDANGDGEILIGVATPGPRDDGAFYQALVDKVVSLADGQGFPEPIVVDNIAQADAGTELSNLAAQGVDVMIVGASEIADPMPELAEEYSDLYWYCSCGAGYGSSEFYSQSQDDSSEISYSAGVATGLLLQDSGGESASFIGCCDLGFEKESFLGFSMGLQAVDPSFTATYVPTGDFNDIAAATEAFNNALAEGADAIYPFLGGAHEPLVQLANENDLITMSAGASDVCDRDDLDYQIAVRFDAGDYLDTLFAELLDGSFVEGDVRVFHVGVDPEPGALICDATPEQQEAMDAAYALIASGDLAADFGAIKGDAYGG